MFHDEDNDWIDTVVQIGVAIMIVACIFCLAYGFLFYAKH